MINVCVPVLKRYDLLEKLIESLAKGTVKPDTVYVMDNGGRCWRPEKSLLTLEILTPTKPLGVAESWNWFIQNVPEERVIVNDDVEFGVISLAKAVEPKEDIVFVGGLGFSCFVIRDSCIQKVGLFDEAISPGYGYYEDEDYMTRIRKERATMADVSCSMEHSRSSTIAVNTPEELEEHHRKFRIAQRNYVEKWGGMPGDIKPLFQYP